MRVFDVDQETDIVLIGGLPTDRRVVDVNETFVDGLVGFRFKSMFADTWSFAISGDVSVGDTDGTWSAQAVLGYYFGAQDQYAARFGYRHMELDFKADARLADIETQLTLSGPLVGFSFIF